MALITGFLSGIISGMGIGGGAILIPALLLFFDINQKQAQGINLLYFIPTAVFALIIHLKNKRVLIKTALIIGSFGVLGAIPGALLAAGMKDGALRKIFGIFLGFIGIYEIYCGIKDKIVKKKSTNT